MNAQKFHFRLGLFAIGGIALMVAGILFLGQGEWFKERLTVETYFDQSVSGFDAGGAGAASGGDVGHVTKIGFVASKYQVPAGEAGRDAKGKYSIANLILVEMTVDRDAVRPLDSPGADPRESAAAMVKDGLRLKMVSSLLGGGGYIDADFVTNPDKYPVPNLPWTPEGIYIPAVPSPGGQLMDTLDELAGEIEDGKPGELLKHINSLVVDANRLTQGVDSASLQKGATALIGDIRTATKSLQRTLDDPHIAQLLADAAGTASNARALTDPEKSKLVALIGDLRVTAGNVNGLLEDPSLKQALANTGPLTTDARKAVSRLAELLASEQQDLAEMIRSFKATGQNVEAITDDAKQNPARILFGEPPPKEKGILVPVPVPVGK